MEEILKPVLPAKWIDKRTKYHINPTGRFVVGGPVGDCGLTGRKIIVDTYGGYARHGGGAFSGKDPSKVDRSAAYAARYVAKNIVAAGLAEKCEVQVSYAIGVAEPTSIMIETFGTSRLSRERLTQIVRAQLRPHAVWPARDARSRPPDLSQVRGVRPLRPHGTRVHLGEDRSRRGAGCGGQERQGCVMHSGRVPRGRCGLLRGAATEVSPARLRRAADSSTRRSFLLSEN